VEIKCQLDATDNFIVHLIASSTCFGHHYAHRQELQSIIQVAAACGIWCFGFQVVSSHLYNTLELLMMGIMVPRNMLSKQ